MLSGRVAYWKICGELQNKASVTGCMISVKMDKKWNAENCLYKTA